LLFRILSPFQGLKVGGGIVSPGFYPGLFGLDPCGVQWIPACAGGILFTSEDACATSIKRIDGDGRGKVKSNIKYKRANIQTKNKIPTTMEGVEIGNEIWVWAGRN
jgi:hypothetical protein